MDLSHKEGSDTLPPVSGEASAEVAHFAMVECIEVAKEEESSFLRPDLNLLMGCLKVEGCSDKGSNAAYSAVQHKSRVFAFGKHHIKLTEGNAFWPEGLGFVEAHVGFFYPALFYLLFD